MIRIAQYQGKGCVSKPIRWQTRSKWSHTAPILRDDSIVESWHKGGVSHVDEGDLIRNLSLNHTANTDVDIFRIIATSEQADIFENFLLSQEGKKYDFLSVLRFISRTPAYENDKWFCSELSFHGLTLADIFIQERICAANVSPQLHGISSLMIPQYQITTIKT